MNKHELNIHDLVYNSLISKIWNQVYQPAIRANQTHTQDPVYRRICESVLGEITFKTRIVITEQVTQTMDKYHL